MKIETEHNIGDTVWSCKVKYAGDDRFKWVSYKGTVTKIIVQSEGVCYKVDYEFRGTPMYKFSLAEQVFKTRKECLAYIAAHPYKGCGTD